MVEFSSVVDALRCATERQRGMDERNAVAPSDNYIEFRIGVHQGDIVAEENDIFGDGVNVAARLERLAEPRRHFAYLPAFKRTQPGVWTSPLTTPNCALTRAHSAPKRDGVRR
jgi:hypothetical protein